MSRVFISGKKREGWGPEKERIAYHLGHDLEALRAEVERHDVGKEVRRVEDAAFEDNADDRRETGVGVITARPLRRLAVDVPDAEREHA